MVSIKVPEGYSFPDGSEEGEPYSEMVTIRHNKDKGHLELQQIAGHEAEEPVEDGSEINNEGDDSYAGAVAKAMPKFGPMA